MNWSSISEFLAMGGYALYVWGAFGVVALSLAAEVLLLGRRWHALRAQLRRAGARGKAGR